METLTDRLSYLMKSKEMKGIDLANATAISATTISRILKGAQSPTADTLYKFAQYFNVTMEFLLTGKESTLENCADTTLLTNEIQLIEYYREMSKDDQDEFLVIAQLKAARTKRKETEKSANSENNNPASETT